MLWGYSLSDNMRRLELAKSSRVVGSAGGAVDMWDHCRFLSHLSPEFQLYMPLMFLGRHEMFWREPWSQKVIKGHTSR